MSLKTQTIKEITRRIWFGKGDNVTWPMPDELIGIELEAENVRGVGGNFLSLAGWDIDSDGSLRNGGREFVLKHPLSGTALSRAIHVLFAMQADDSGYPMSYTANPRAGTHVHINWIDNTVGSAAALLALMYCIEPMVYNWADEDRAWCSYCNPLSDISADILSRLLNVEVPNADTSNGPAWLMVDLEDERLTRYHGLNVAALEKYGTIEFRYFPSTRNKEDMIKWVKFVQLAKLCAVAHEDSVVNLLDKLATGSIADFLTEWFGMDELDAELLTAVNDAQSIVREKAVELLTIMDVKINPDNDSYSHVRNATSPAALRYLRSLSEGNRTDRPEQVEAFDEVVAHPMPAPPRATRVSPVLETYEQFLSVNADSFAAAQTRLNNIYSGTRTGRGLRSNPVAQPDTSSDVFSSEQYWGFAEPTSNEEEGEI